MWQSWDFLYHFNVMDGRAFGKSTKRWVVPSHSVMSNSLWPHGLESARRVCPWGFSRQEYWSGLPCPPPGNRPNPGIELRSPALQADSLPSELQESPRILKWAAYPFSGGTSGPRNQTRVSYIAGGFFTSWATQETQIKIYRYFTTFAGQKAKSSKF